MQKEPITCECESPQPMQLATRKGAARTHCARCKKPIPLRLKPQFPTAA
jgi:hypothetical protein